MRRLLWAAALLVAAPAVAHEGSDAISTWYRSLEAPDGSSCCNMQDCAPTDARIVDGHWEVPDKNAYLTSNSPATKWVPVPPENILRRENVDGRPIACWFAGHLRCFVPPAGT